jgi:N-acetylglucosaminyl-diphospho-decaprenol L-rhamnosyltransferase
MSPTLAVVIVNFNAGDALIRCVRSLAPALDGAAWETVIVDNASNDGSERRAAAEPGVRVIREGRNAGFAAGANRGAGATEAPWLLFLNPDCELLPGRLTDLLLEFEQDARCALIGPGILEADGEVQGSARGDPSMLTGLFGRSSWLTARFPHWRIVRRNVLAPAVRNGRTSQLVDWVSGACMLARRSAFDSVGGFDEGYFLYWEDADLCRRLRQAGYTIRYAPAPRVRHTVGISSRTARATSIRAFHRSAYRYYVRWSGTSPWSPARAFAFAALRARCAWALWVSAGKRVRP